MGKALTSLVFSLMLSMGFVEGCGPTLAPEPPATPADPAAGKALEDLLNRWEKQSGEVRTIKAEFRRTDHSELFGRDTNYEGIYAAKDNDTAFLSFDEVGKAGGTEQLLRTSDRFYHFKKETRQVFMSPKIRRKDLEDEIAKMPARRRDFLQDFFLKAIVSGQEFLRSDGSFFFFKIRAEDLKARYRVELMPERDGRYHLLLAPKSSGDRMMSSQIRLLLDKETLLPVAVKIWSPAGKDTNLFTFTKNTINSELAESWFQLKMPEGWTVIDLTAEKPRG